MTGSAEDLSTWAEALERVIAGTLAPRAIDRVAVIAETGSTQDAAHAMCGGRPGLLVIAGRQTAGRGRLGRVWHDAPGRSLAMTLAIDAAGIGDGIASLAGGVAVCRAAQKLGVSGLGLKWPNDVVERTTGRKLAGVLVERCGGVLLVGVGLNVSNAEDGWSDAIRGRGVSLSMLGAVASRRDAACALLESFEGVLQLDGGALSAEWARRDVLVGTVQRVRADRREVCGTIERIDPLSRVVVRQSDGKRVVLDALQATVASPDM